MPPTRPVIAARLELLDNKGLNSFSKYSLPQAVLKFRQGYGRLIRTKNDKGAIIILDKRVITKRYGREFLKSLPSQSILINTFENLIDSWINGMVILNNPFFIRITMINGNSHNIIKRIKYF